MRIDQFNNLSPQNIIGSESRGSGDETGDNTSDEDGIENGDETGGESGNEMGDETGDNGGDGGGSSSGSSGGGGGQLPEGHSFGKPTSKVLDDGTIELTYKCTDHGETYVIYITVSPEQ